MADETVYSVVPTPLGPLTVAANSAGLILAEFGEASEAEIRRAGSKHQLLRRFSPRNARGGQSVAERHLRTGIDAIRNYFKGEFDAFATVRIRPQGTEFQQQVWKALRKIRPGTTKSYSELAQQLGNPSAVRAVGMACKRNPLCLLIPCHRVIGKNQSLTGFAGGIERKAALLKLEGLSLG
ncbi:MAG: methylated-DNA--[protein]-cysteine S-methyltransferase [Bdellovibrionales bacterium]|nr:methylated-DNA--[protein]-cysteine S-methyltransferase [Bdellovibrionales bacterium]